MTRPELAEKFALELEKERSSLGYSQMQMAKALHLSLSAYKRILTGETGKIDFYILYQMYRLTNKLGYELGGVVDPYLDAFSKLRKLSLHQLRFISSVIDFELDFYKGLEDDGQKEDYATLFVPTGCMQDGMIYDSCFMDKINIAPYRRRYGNAIDCCIRVTSAHLQPVYCIDDILLINCQPIRDGDTGIFVDKSTGLAYVRKFHMASPCQLEPLNHYGHIIHIDLKNISDMNRWIHFGRVIAKVRI